MNVKQQQCLLAFLGCYSDAVDGIRGPATAAAILRFQKQHQLKADGLCGPETEQALRQAVAAGEKKEDFWQEIRYFTREEFRCPCGKCGGFPAEPEEKLVRLEDRVRGHFGKPIRNSSGVRCKQHNARVGGVANSRHLYGRAVDFAVTGVSAKTVLAWVKQQPETRYCYAIDGSYVHMDVDE